MKLDFHDPQSGGLSEQQTGGTILSTVISTLISNILAGVGGDWLLDNDLISECTTNDPWATS